MIEASADANYILSPADKYVYNTHFYTTLVTWLDHIFYITCTNFRTLVSNKELDLALIMCTTSMPVLWVFLWILHKYIHTFAVTRMFNFILLIFQFILQIDVRSMKCCIQYKVLHSPETKKKLHEICFQKLKSCTYKRKVTPLKATTSRARN